MNWTVPVALYGWIALVASVFAVMPPRRAVLFCYFAGWMFLPVAGIQAIGFFDYNKGTAIPLIVLAAVIAFDGERLRDLHPRWIDLPIAIFCAVPLATSLNNGLGWYDGLSAVAYQTITWGLPYATGRMYFSTPEGARELALAMVAAGVVYAPLCLWEIRMSPQLHASIYGFHQHDWSQTMRGGTWRPMVFMQHGLMVGLWMCAASLVALALWMSGALRRFWGMPFSLVVLGLAGTTILCKSFGAIALFLIGALVLWSMRFARTSLAMALLLCVPTGYVALRISGGWAGDGLISAVSEVSTKRADSLEFRINSEKRLQAKAEEKPWLGWGGWSRSLTSRSDDPESAGLTIIDSLWIIVFGKHGFVGLAAVLACFFLPVLVLWRRCPPRLWDQGIAVWPWALAVVLTLYSIDSLVNAMHNPVYLLMAGGLCGLAPIRARMPYRVRTQIRAWPSRPRLPVGVP